MVKWAVCAPVAQMDRALASGARGRGFEPLRARHSFGPFPEGRLTRENLSGPEPDRRMVPGLAAFTTVAISASLGLIRSHRFLLRITTAIFRPFRFCWWGRLASVVSNTSKPASSATRRSSPFKSVLNPARL